MCYSKAEGGKRCEYTTLINNERRRLAYVHRNESQYTRDGRIGDGIKKWKLANPELVQKHAPKKYAYAATPGKKDLPEMLTEQLTHDKKPVKAPWTTQEESVEHLQKMYEEYEHAIEGREQFESVASSYTGVSYEGINNTLRRRAGFKKRENDIRTLDEAFSNPDVHKQSETPRKLYRKVKIPFGWTPEKYAEHYFSEGMSIKDPAFVSTSESIDFIAHSAHDYTQSRKQQFIVFEILTRQGISLARDENERVGNIQSFERERLLPRNTKMRVAAIRPKQKYIRGGSEALQRHFGRWSRPMAERTNYTLIQLVDEKLISDPFGTKTFASK